MGQLWLPPPHQVESEGIWLAVYTRDADADRSRNERPPQDRGRDRSLGWGPASPNASDVKGTAGLARPAVSILFSRKVVP